MHALSEAKAASTHPSQHKRLYRPCPFHTPYAACCMLFAMLCTMLYAASCLRVSTSSCPPRRPAGPGTSPQRVLGLPGLHSPWDGPTGL